MKVITVTVNHLEFIELQYYTLKKFFRGVYEFIVFNDAKGFSDFSNNEDISIRGKIEDICKKLGIQCINIPNDHHRYNLDSSSRMADSMNYILNYQVQNPDKYLLLHRDMFLVSDFNVDKYEKYACAIVLQSENNYQTNYCWNGLYYFDMTKLKNINYMNWNCCMDCDTGSMMQDWLRREMENKMMPNRDEIRWKNEEFHTNTIYFMKHLWTTSWNLSELPEHLKDNEDLKNFLVSDLRNRNGKFHCEIYDNTFLYYRGCDNWRQEGQEIHRYLTGKLKQTLLRLCQ